MSKSLSSVHMQYAHYGTMGVKELEETDCILWPARCDIRNEECLFSPSTSIALVVGYTIIERLRFLITS